MLTHHHPAPKLPRRVVVLGSAGFIGSAVVQCVQAQDIPVLRLSRNELDLLAPDASVQLSRLLRSDDTLVITSAIAPCKNLAMLCENMQMVQSVCSAIERTPVAHVVYVSSDAVYKDQSHPMTEVSCAEPGSLHGAMHLTREIALRQTHTGPLAIVRPTLVYGQDDPHNGYGPNRFLRFAVQGKEISLFGEGEELRDHVDVQDVAQLIFQMVLHRSDGVINAVSGAAVSFRELAELLAGSVQSPVAVRRSPRTGPMPHNGYRTFDNQLVSDSFPGFEFRHWRTGLLKLLELEQRKRSDKK